MKVADRPAAQEDGAVHPAIEHEDTGMLDGGDGDFVYWEVCGNPQGKPVFAKLRPAVR
jgi:proline iminopeptidase